MSSNSFHQTVGHWSRSWNRKCRTTTVQVIDAELIEPRWRWEFSIFFLDEPVKTRKKSRTIREWSAPSCYSCCGKITPKYFCYLSFYFAYCRHSYDYVKNYEVICIGVYFFQNCLYYCEVYSMIHAFFVTLLVLNIVEILDQNGKNINEIKR